MAMFGNPSPVDGAKERFAQLHFRAACVRLEILAQMLQTIERDGGLEQAPLTLVNEAVAAAADVAENLRWSYERLTETGHRLTGEPPTLDFPGTRKKSEELRGFPGMREERGVWEEPGE